MFVEQLLLPPLDLVLSSLSCSPGQRGILTKLFRENYSLGKELSSFRDNVKVNVMICFLASYITPNDESYAIFNNFSL